MSLENEPQNLEQKTEQPKSLAELSRQYLSGKVGLDEYLVLEQQMTPRFGESAIATLAIEEEIKLSRKAKISQEQIPPKDNDSVSEDRTHSKDGKE